MSETEIIPKVLEKNLSLIENEDSQIVVENGIEFVAAVKKEYIKQQAVKTCDDLLKITMPVDSIPVNISSAVESNLADSFEISEE